MTDGLGVLLVGLGGFGRNHLRAWHEMGEGARLWVAEVREDLHAEARLFNVPPERLTTDLRTFLDRVDVVDIVTPTTTHFELCSLALEAGKHVFVEKPMTMTVEEAEDLTRLVRETGRVLQVGYYYRFHPINALLKGEIDAGVLGTVRYMSGNFMGFKRARTDVGVTHTDGIHFIDLFNWFLGAPPVEVYAVTRDHFSRGLEDLSIVLMRYGSGVVAKVESGYIQPGQWRDKVVPNAYTSKAFFVCGSVGAAEVDLEIERLVLHVVRHEFRDGTWFPEMDGSRIPVTGTATPVQMIVAELEDFRRCCAERSRPSADVVGSGVVLAKVMEGIYRSAERGASVALPWSEAEERSLAAGLTRPSTGEDQE